MAKPVKSPRRAIVAGEPITGAPTQPIICLHRGTALISRLIRWSQRSEYSHASIIMPDGRHFESREGVGVVCHPQFTLTNRTEVVDKFVYRKPLTAVEIMRIDCFLSAQVGKPYDWPMVFGFVSRSDTEAESSEGKWFCSEVIFSGTAEANPSRRLLDRIEPWAVHPGHISLSTLITKLP